MRNEMFLIAKCAADERPSFQGILQEPQIIFHEHCSSRGAIYKRLADYFQLLITAILFIESPGRMSFRHSARLEEALRAKAHVSAVSEQVLLRWPASIKSHATTVWRQAGDFCSGPGIWVHSHGSFLQERAQEKGMKVMRSWGWGALWGERSAVTSEMLAQVRRVPQTPQEDACA